jgi:hypothetical protein
MQGRCRGWVAYPGVAVEEESAAGKVLATRKKKWM